jgi:hypothetical protein
LFSKKAYVTLRNQNIGVYIFYIRSIWVISVYRSHGGTENGESFEKQGIAMLDREKANWASAPNIGHRKMQRMIYNWCETP